MQVRDCDGREVGKVEGVILDQEQRQGKYIVFRRDSFSPLQLIPAALVQDVSSTDVKLSIAWEFVEKLPEYSHRAAQRMSA
jgi:sporulation protein YlmC with PRC-barrel domain